MPASLYPTSNPAASLSLGNLDLIMMESSSSSSNSFDLNSGGAAEQIALQLALLQQQGQHHDAGNNLNGLHLAHSDLLNGHGASSGSLEDLKSTQRKSQNMTECVPVPSSEHVAEIVGRQGCKIKALRAKTNTYIKTPVRGEEPVFVVTGRKEDVALAKREILSAADHFSQIRASRKSNINSTLAFGQLMANTPGQTTVQVRVPYRVVGLVVGPKGATIKRIQQQTHTYIVTPSRDKEPVFEVTGLPENVEAARKEIEAHIAIRTGSTDFTNGQASSSNGSGNSGSMFFNMNDNNGENDMFSTSGGLNSPFSSSSGNLDHVNSILNGADNNGHHPSSSTSSFGFGTSGKNSTFTLANLLSSSTDMGSIAWSNGTDSHDSGIGHSPPFDNGGIMGSSGGKSAFKSFMSTGVPSSNGASSNDATLNGIWGELNKVLGGLDLNNGDSSNNEINKQFNRSSLDLGTLGRPLGETSKGPSAVINNTAMGRQMSLPTETATTTTTTTPLPGFNGILSTEFNETKDQVEIDGATAANNAAE